jgi:hypothetical protein
MPAVFELDEAVPGLIVAGRSILSTFPEVRDGVEIA